MKITLKRISSWFLVIGAIFLILGLSGCKEKDDIEKTYNITYHLDGGQGLNLPVTFQTNDRLTLDSPQKAGYKFVGWYSNSDFSGEIVTEIIGTCQKDLDLYAKWNEIYYLSLIGNGGQIEENTIEFTKDDEIILPIPTKNNANFIGWYSNSDFSGEMVTKIEKGTTNNVTFYAKWQDIYEVNFILNEGSLEIGNQMKFTEDDEINLPIPSKNNSLFKGWYQTIDFSGDVVTKIEKGTTHNITLYAKWERLYQLSYDANGGTMPDNYDTSYYLGEGKVLPIPTKNGYLFKGWSESPNHTIRVHFTIPISYEEDLDLTAVWEKQLYTINYVLGDEVFADKHQLFLAFFTDFYYYIVDYRQRENYLMDRGVNDLETFLSICGSYTGGAAGMGNVGNLLGQFYLRIDVGGNIDDQTADDGFIGYCLENNKYVEFVYFIQDFFYWWRLDEGYTNGPDDPEGTGSDFLASAWASVVDTAKFFYYDKDTLPSYFISKGHIPAFYDRIPYIVNLGENTFIYTYDWEEGLNLPTSLTMDGYTFVGWFDNENFEGDALEYLPTNIYHNITLYAKFVKNNNSKR